MEFMGNPCQKSKNKSKYVSENFQVVFKDVDETELLDASLRIVRSTLVSLSLTFAAAEERLLT